MKSESKVPENINELRSQLLEAFDWVRSDPRRANQVKEMTNTAGKILVSIRTEVEYCLLRGEEPEIPFMGKDRKPLKPGAKLIRS